MSSKEITHRPRVVLADDQTDLFDSLRHLLEPQFEVVGTAQDGQSALVAAEDLKPDVMVLDISMPRVSGMEAARKLREKGAAPKIVFLSMHDEPDIVKTALGIGASAYVLKTAAHSELAVAVSEAVAGRCFVSSRLRRNLG